MITKLLIKIATMSKRSTLIFLLFLASLYTVGMTLILYGVCVPKASPIYFIVGLVIAIPTCIASLMASVSSNYGKNIEEAEEKIKEAKVKNKD